jgi:hypothetical protein
VVQTFFVRDAFRGESVGPCADSDTSGTETEDEPPPLPTPMPRRFLALFIPLVLIVACIPLGRMLCDKLHEHIPMAGAIGVGHPIVTGMLHVAGARANSIRMGGVCASTGGISVRAQGFSEEHVAHMMQHARAHAPASTWFDFGEYDTPDLAIVRGCTPPSDAAAAILYCLMGPGFEPQKGNFGTSHRVDGTFGDWEAVHLASSQAEKDAVAAGNAEVGVWVLM